MCFVGSVGGDRDHTPPQIHVTAEGFAVPTDFIQGV